MIEKLFRSILTVLGIFYIYIITYAALYVLGIISYSISNWTLSFNPGDWTYGGREVWNISSLLFGTIWIINIAVREYSKREEEERRKKADGNL